MDSLGHLSDQAPMRGVQHRELCQAIVMIIMGGQLSSPLLIGACLRHLGQVLSSSVKVGKKSFVRPAVVAGS